VYQQDMGSLIRCKRVFAAITPISRSGCRTVVSHRCHSGAPGSGTSGGLGLAIAQAIVTSQRGTIQCESIIGVGSKFTVGLPGISKIAV
jgi:hypothetical protein